MKTKYGPHANEAKKKLLEELKKFTKGFAVRAEETQKDLGEDDRQVFLEKMYAAKQFADVSKTLCLLGDEKKSSTNYELLEWGFLSGISDRILNNDWHALRVLTGGVLAALSEQIISDRIGVESDPLTAITLAVGSFKRTIEEARFAAWLAQIKPQIPST
jgi:hypothetical protein